MTYIERPKGAAGAEAGLDGGKTWRRVIGITMLAESAQKCFDGKKTQTRRLVNAPDWWEGHLIWSGSASATEAVLASRDGSKQKSSPYRVGDIFYIREPWRSHATYDRLKPSDLPEASNIFFEGDASTQGLRKANAGKLRPAMFMPRRFARPARYEVTAVKCERVNEISRAGVLAEGVELLPPSSALMADTEARDRFSLLWNSIHSAPGTRFEDGPWVWVPEFRRVR